MRLQFKVSGAQINFDVTEFGIIRSYEFSYSVPDSKYAKSHKDHRTLIIKGSVSKTLSKAPEVIKQIRKWAKIKFKDRDTYYHNAKITVIHADVLVREITFPDSFVKDFTEEIDPHTGDGIYTLTLMQKLDKRINVIVDPFNEQHLGLSKMMEEAIKKREAKSLENAALKPLPLGEEEVLNSPYWVELSRLVISQVRANVSLNVNLRTGSQNNHTLADLNVPYGLGTGYRNRSVEFSLQVGSGLNVVKATMNSNVTTTATEARILDGRVWLKVSVAGNTGWINAGTRDKIGGAGSPVTAGASNRRLVTMLNLANMNSVAPIRGRTRTPNNNPTTRMPYSELREINPNGIGNLSHIGSPNLGGLVHGAHVHLADGSSTNPVVTDGGWRMINTNWGGGSPPILVTRTMMRSFGWLDGLLTDRYIHDLNDVLHKFGITDWGSIRLFMATCGHESARGSLVIEEGDSAYFAGNGYDRRTRGAGYIQVTHNSNQIRFLRSGNINDNFGTPNGSEDTAGYIAAHYPWEAAAWFWKEHQVQDGFRLDEYVRTYGDSLGVFFITQCWVNGWPSGFNGRNIPNVTFDVRDSNIPWEVRNQRLYIHNASTGNIDRFVSRAPNGWDDRLKNFNDAQRIFIPTT